jgi:type I restriction enzyme R subunit
VSEASLNGFASGDIARKIQTDPYRFLICADKFQTGYDEPLLHTMYVDKRLAGIKAVQTLSRLNRGHPQKHDCFVLDFQNNSEAITLRFPGLLPHDAAGRRDRPEQAARPEGGAGRGAGLLAGAGAAGGGDVSRWRRPRPARPDPRCVRRRLCGRARRGWPGGLQGQGQGVLPQLRLPLVGDPYSNAGWEKLSIFLDLLTPKLPAPKEEDLARGILEAIDMDSYRVEKKAAMKIALADQDAEIEPLPTDTAATSRSPSWIG